MTTFSDDFNRADGAPGANWVDGSGLWTIISQQLSSGSAGGTIVLRAATAMATNDNYAQITITATAVASHGVWCRGNTGFTQGYLWRNDGTSWVLFSNVGGSFTSLGSFAGAAVAGDVAKVQAVGSTITGYVNGVSRVSVTNTAVATGTSVGLRADSTSALRFDNFASGDVTSGVAGGAAFTGTATLSAAGLRVAAGDTALTATAALAGSGVRATAGNASLTAAASLTADSTRATAGTSGLTALAALTATGTTAAVDDAALATTASLIASGQRAAAGDTTLTAAVALAADGAAGVPPVLGDAALNIAGALTADGARATSADAGLNTAAGLAAAGTMAVVGTAAIAIAVAFTAGGTTLSAHDDVAVTVGVPSSPWAVGQPQSEPWAASELQLGWEVTSPW